MTIVEEGMTTINYGTLMKKKDSDEAINLDPVYRIWNIDDEQLYIIVFEMPTGPVPQIFWTYDLESDRDEDFEEIMRLTRLTRPMRKI